MKDQALFRRTCEVSLVFACLMGCAPRTATSAPISTSVPTNTQLEPAITATTISVPTLLISPQANSNGTMFRGDLQHTGVFEAGGIQPVGEMKWKIKTEGQVWSSPVIADDILYFGSVDHHLYAVDLETER